MPHRTATDPETSATPIVTRKMRLSPRLYINREDFMAEPPKGYHRLVPNGLARLKGAFIIRCVGFDTDENGNVTKIRAEKTDEVKAKGVLQWIDRDTAVDITINRLCALVPDGDGNMEFSERINRDSLVRCSAKAERGVSDLPAGEAVQFFRNQRRSVPIGIGLDRWHKSAALREYGSQLLDIVTQRGPIQFDPGRPV